MYRNASNFIVNAQVISITHIFVQQMAKPLQYSKGLICMGMFRKLI